MRYIHENKGWPGFAWENSRLAALLAEVRYQQGKWLGKIGTYGLLPRAEASVDTLTSEVVKSSAIEGEKLNAEEVRSSIARKLGLEAAGARKAARNVEGIVEMTLDATRKYAAKMTKKRLFGWHELLFSGSESEDIPIAIGKWREGAMRVVSGPMGREIVHFVAPAAERVEEEMAKFLDWFNSPPSLDPVLKAGVAHFWFVTIHPFEDGNGRIARAIGEMALARADGTGERFYSMSSQIAAERKTYYAVLEAAQRGDLDITDWLEWFLQCLGRAIDASESRLAAVLRKDRLWKVVNEQPLNERQQLVLSRMLSDFQGFLTTSKYAKLAKCSTDTALRDIRELVERRILLQNQSGGRSTSYRLSDTEESSS